MAGNVYLLKHSRAALEKDSNVRYTIVVILCALIVMKTK